MAERLSKKEIKKRAEMIETIYQDYKVKLNNLKRKQTDAINQFIKELEQRKIEKIRQLLKDN